MTEAYRFPIDIDRLDTSHQAVQMLYQRDPDRPDRHLYPWRCLLSHHTHLPAMLLSWLDAPLDADQEIGRELARALLVEPLHAQALFGKTIQEGKFDTEFEQAPALPIDVPDNNGRVMHHFIWQQIYESYPVIGSGVRVHGIVDTVGVTITNSYLPISTFRTFAPTITEEKAKQIGLATFFQPLLAQPIAPMLHLAPDDRESFLRIRSTPHLAQFWQRIENIESSASLAQFDNDTLALINLELQVEIIPIASHSHAIMPIDGDYRLIQRIGITALYDEVWVVDVDVERGVALALPWPGFIRAPAYYQTSGELANSSPSGNPNNLDLAKLANIIELHDHNNVVLSSATLATATDEAVTVAAGAQRLYNHFKDNLVFDVAQSPTILTKLLPLGGKTKFTYATANATAKPKVTFEFDQVGQGIPEGTLRVIHPARDPEVVMHEFTHAFLWRLNPASWVTPVDLSLFGRALQEGYAMYFSRSVAAGSDTQISSAAVQQEATQAWARGAYPPTPTNWGERWLFDRNRNNWKIGEDVLPAPHIFRFGSSTFNSSQDIAAEQVYEIGMIWARALWDLRHILGGLAADQAAVNAYLYLHGYIISFELASEAVLNAAARLLNINLISGLQTIWGERQMPAGQAINGFDRKADGSLIAAATDQGILLSTNQGQSWTMMQQPLAAGSSQQLTGVTAVTFATNNDRLYASAQLPPANLTGSTQHPWNPGIFWITDPLDEQAEWNEVANWPADEIVTSLQEATPDKILIGSNKGAVFYNALNQQLEDRNPDKFNALDLAIATRNGQNGVIICMQTRFRLKILTQPNWSLSNAILLNSTNGFTCMVAHQNQIFAGTLAGLHKVVTDSWVITTFTDANVNSLPVLAVALSNDNSRLYVATLANILVSVDDPSDPAVAFTSIQLPCNGAGVICLQHIGNNTVLAGTTAHGIWLYDGTEWTPVHSAAPTQFHLANGTKIALSFTVPQVNIAYTVQKPNNIGLDIFLLGALQHPLSQNTGGAYFLTERSVIAYLDNQSGTNLHLTLTVTSGQIQFLVVS